MTDYSKMSAEEAIIKLYMNSRCNKSMTRSDISQLIYAQRESAFRDGYEFNNFKYQARIKELENRLEWHKSVIQKLGGPEYPGNKSD